MNVTEKRIKGAPQGWFVLFWSGIKKRPDNDVHLHKCPTFGGHLKTGQLSYLICLRIMISVVRFGICAFEFVDLLFMFRYQRRDVLSDVAVSFVNGYLESLSKF